MISISATSIKRPSTTGRLQSIQLKRDVFNKYNLITLLAIELDGTTAVDLKPDWWDVRAVISLLFKSDMAEFQKTFLGNDPASSSVQDNWDTFKTKY